MEAAQSALPSDATGQPRVALVGTVGVGKTTLWHHLASARGRKRAVPPGQRAPVIRIGVLRGGLMRGYAEEAILVDTPGVCSLFTHSEDERVAHQLLIRGGVDRLLVVLDAKNLRRSLVLALEIAEFGLPMGVVLNMVDEAENRGIEISVRALRHALGLGVVPTVANEQQGAEDIPELVASARPASQDVVFPAAVERALAELGALLHNGSVPPRALGILLLAGSEDAHDYVRRTLGQGVLAEVTRVAQAAQQEFGRPLDVVLTESYSAVAERLVAQVQRAHQRSPQLLVRFGRWSQRPLTGLPIALGLLTAMYYWVGVFAAGWLVDQLNHRLFERIVLPAVDHVVARIPSAFLRQALMDADFGVLTTGLFLAFGLVLPVLFCFYLFFGVLEESGYLPRFSVLVNRVLQRIGLNGKGVMPLVMGLSCVTMAVLTTRMLDSRRERIIATFLLALGLPCAPLVGVMMVVLGHLPWYATVFVFGFILVQTILAGLLVARLLPGRRAEFIMELPPMRVPNGATVLRRTWRRTYLFMKEAVPLFLLASFLVFLFHYLGGLHLLERASRPLMGGLLGLPDESVRVFMKTMIRRETGAVELEHLRGSFTNLQLVVTLLVMTFLIPCVNTVIVILKEQGLRVGTLLLAAVFVYALALGGLANHGCRWLRIGFG